MGSNIKLHTLTKSLNSTSTALASNYLTQSDLSNAIGSINTALEALGNVDTSPTETLRKKVETLEKQVLGYKLKNQELENKIQELERTLAVMNSQIMSILNNKVEMSQYIYDTNNINSRVDTLVASKSDLEEKVMYNTSYIIDLQDRVDKLKEENK